MSVPILSGLREKAATYDGFILDQWGVLHDGTHPYPGVIDALERLRQHGKRLVVLSNAPRRAGPIGERMAAIGIPPELFDGIHSSGEEVWQLLDRRDEPFYAALGRRCYHIGPPRDEGMTAGLDLERVEDIAAADFILNTGPWGWETETDAYDGVLREARLRDLPMICANADLVVMYQGKRMPCAGTLAQRYERLGGRVRWHGKPYQSVYDTCFAMLGLAQRDRILAVGDSLHTDIAGANAAGVDSLLVASGIHAEELGLTAEGPLDPTQLAAALAGSAAQPIAAIKHFAW